MAVVMRQQDVRIAASAEFHCLSGTYSEEKGLYPRLVMKRGKDRIKQTTVSCAGCCCECQRLLWRIWFPGRNCFGASGCRQQAG